MRNNRVVITGLGVVSSIGVGRKEFQDNLFAGKSGISKITSFNTEEFATHYGGEVKNFCTKQFMPKTKIAPYDRTVQFAIGASTLAIGDANLSLGKINRERFGVILGSTIGIKFVEELFESWVKKDKDKIKKYKILHSSVNNLSSNVANYFGIRGDNYLIATACAAGNYAIAYASDLIKTGRLSFALAGAADFFSKLAFIGFHRIYAMAPKLCQPFDKNRKGMLLGEGAGILLLESLDSALKRKARIYAEALGYGLSCDAYHVTAPKQEGIENAMQKALKDSNLLPEDVDYICAHGTGTVLNDRVECAAIKKVFGKRYKKVPVSSIKSMIGHTMAAASGMEAAACCLAIKNGVIPPTINFKTHDPECDIDCVPNKARKKNVKIALNNSFAFGGNNCCLILGAIK